MFKDLMQAIFTEEVEPEEENETKKEEIQAAQETPISQPQEEVVPQESTFVEPKIDLSQTQMDEPVIPTFGQKEVQPQKKSNIFTGLNVDDIASEEPRPRKKLYHYDRSKVHKVRRTQEDLEYTPIISPIFGNMEEDKKDTSKVHNAVELSKPEQIEDYMTVLSPMYGDRLDARPVVESIPKMETPKKATTKKESKSNLSLDDMLERTSVKKTKQTSLFPDKD